MTPGWFRFLCAHQGANYPFTFRVVGKSARQVEVWEAVGVWKPMTENDYGGRGVSARLAILRDVSRDREVYCVHDINSAFRRCPLHHVRN